MIIWGSRPKWKILLLDSLYVCLFAFLSKHLVCVLFLSSKGQLGSHAALAVDGKRKILSM